jgi:hypothetical protein
MLLLSFIFKIIHQFISAGGFGVLGFWGFGVSGCFDLSLLTSSFSSEPLLLFQVSRSFYFK